MITLTFKAQTDKHTIQQYLTDADKFVSVHPLIYKMERVSQNSYKVFEKVTFGPIPYRFTYHASITLEAHEVKMLATIMGLTKISMHFTFVEEDDFTLIHEKIHIRSPLPIKKYMFALFTKQHQLLFSNIEKQSS